MDLMDSIKLVADGFWFFFTFFWFLWVPTLLLFLIQVAFKLYKNARLAKSGIAELDNLGGEDFEKYLEILFRKLDYSVTRTPFQGDYGADLVVQKAGTQTVVQAKRYNRRVGVKAIQEAVAAKEYYRCAKAMVVTNNYYSQQAKKLAAANNVELWDRDKLVTLLLAEQQPLVAIESAVSSTGNALVTSEKAAQSTSASAHCTTCGKAISPQVSSYCLSHPERFGGRVYCYEHQKTVRYPAKRGA